MATTQRVAVAIYEHRHGTDVRVFARDEDALAWRRDIALEYYDQEIGGDRPETDDEIETAYWDLINDEYFNVESCPVET